MAKLTASERASFYYMIWLRQLQEEGPQRLYILYGQEDYLQEQFLQEIQKCCLGSQDAGAFGLRIFKGALPDLQTLRQAVDAVPFLSPRSLVIWRDANLGTLNAGAQNELADILSSIPEDTTVVLSLEPGTKPDRRMKSIKRIMDRAVCLEFRDLKDVPWNDRDTQHVNDGILESWVKAQFSGFHKKISDATVEYLVFLCGSHMRTLRQEIEKIALYAKETEVRREDIDAVATRAPEAVVFAVGDHVAEKNTAGALLAVQDLLANRDVTPVLLLTLLGRQMRQLYCAKTAPELLSRLVKSNNVAKRLKRQAAKFSENQLSRSLLLCAETDYAMKSGGGDAAGLLKLLIIRMVADL
jgi:DNA polymerase-3 subunit delta